MKQKEIQKCVNKYTYYMEEIKKRTDVVSRLYILHKANQLMTGYIETDIDTVYLQLRKIIELIMFSCVVANKSAGLTLNKTLKKGWEIKKIKASLAKFNTDFFPEPKVDDGFDENGIRKVANLEHSSKKYMSEPELFTAYGKAGNYLHAQRIYPYGNPQEKIKILKKGVDEVNQLVALLNHHWVNITKDAFFAVVMQGDTDRKVHVSYLEKVNNPKSPIK